MELLSVGDVAARLGVAPSTVRMWGRRYGLQASEQSPGGHRRYTTADVALLQRMHAAMTAGASPAQAAAEAIRVTSRAPARTGPGGPGGSVLAMPGASPAARGLARAAFRLDEMGVEDALVDALRAQGTLATWDGIIRPVLVASGDYWQRTGQGIEIEHLLTQAVTTALVRHAAESPEIARVDHVLLASGAHEEHTLALYAVRAALAEAGVPSRLLGPRTPVAALAAAARRTRAPGVFIWLSRPDATVEEGLSQIANAHRRLRVVLGGVGWAAHEEVAAGTVSDSLPAAVDLLRAAWLDRPAARGRSNK